MNSSVRFGKMAYFLHVLMVYIYAEKNIFEL